MASTGPQTKEGKALDGELYRAIKALRDQQGWRLRSGIEEVVEAQPG